MKNDYSMNLYENDAVLELDLIEWQMSEIDIYWIL